MGHGSWVMGYESWVRVRVYGFREWYPPWAGGDACDRRGGGPGGSPPVPVDPPQDHRLPPVGSLEEGQHFLPRIN